MDNKTINRKVATAIGLEISEERTAMFENLLDNFNETDDSIMVVIDGNIESFDPCNVANDAWPIMMKNGISLIHIGGNEYAATDGFWHHSGHISDVNHEILQDNPLLAAMICFLKMKDAENA